MPIYDLSYRRIEGVRHARGFRFLPIASTGFRHFFRKKGHMALVIVSIAPYCIGIFFLLVPFLFSNATDQFGPSPIARFFHVNPDTVNYAIGTVSFWLVLLVALVAGSGAIANDMRSNALEIYFSRPITRFDYVAGKLGTVLGLTLLISAAPLAFLWLLDVALAKEAGYLRAQLPLVVKMVVAQLAVSIPYCLIVLALSSLARSQRNVMIVFGALVIGMRVLAAALFQVTSDGAFRLINLRDCVSRVAYDVLGVAEFAKQAESPVAMASKFLRAGGIDYEVSEMPLRHLESWQPMLVVAGWVIASLLVLRWKVRGYEVVKG